MPENKNVSKFKIISIFFLPILLLVLSFGLTGQTPEPTLEDLDSLMENKTLENCQKAAEGYEALLKNDPDNYDLLCKAAIAYVGIVDIKTDALLVEKDEFKSILKDLGKKANDYAEKALQIKPQGKEALAYAIVSYGYYSASFGIFKAIFKGAAGHYKDLCKRLIEVDPKYLGALAYRSLGKLYHVAPWPVGSKKKALKNYLKAIETDPTVLFSHFFAGEIYFDKDRFDDAEKEFMFVIENPPHESEKHFIKTYKLKARDYIAKIAKERR